VARDQLIGKNDFDFFPASEAEFFVAKDRETLRNKTMVDIPEEPIRTASGPRWLHTQKVPIVGADGTPRFLLGISRDITDDKLAAARLIAAHRANDQTNREIESFTYSVVHDLRAPLRTILGYARAVIEDHHAALPGEAAHQLGRIRESAERMTVLIDDLVGLSRVTRAELVSDRVDLTAIAHSVVAGLRALVPDRTVEVEIQPELVVDGDARMLAVVLENLFDNAWKFTSKRPDARIELGARDGAFFVRDNGAGFDPAQTEQLFGVFHRLHRESDFPGTGIGLATVARIVHRHRGRVWAEGAIGEGATFYFALGEPP
jgi:light-regulated signal transduction histidine kinase (bacteriophytochrome)